MIENQEPAFLYYRSPSAIRGTTFGHRLRGLDEGDVREFLDLLADQVEAADTERSALRADNDRMRAELSDRDPDEGEINPQAVALFSQAQQVADRLVEEAVQHARDVMVSARSQQREILQRAHEAAESAVRASAASHADGAVGGYTHPVPEVEYVRTFAQVAQVQLRSVLDALAEQVDKLGEVPKLADGGEPDGPKELPRQRDTDPAAHPSSVLP